MNKIVKNSAIASIMLLAMTACSHDTDIYNPNQKEVDTKKTYAENFAEKFPSVSLNQSWDYSTGGFVLKSGTRAGENVSIQSISGLDFGVSDNKPTENTNIFNTVATTLPDYEKHEGQPVVLVAPSSSFYIFPISAQGQNTYDLVVKVGDEAPVKVFSKTGQTSGNHT